MQIARDLQTVIQVIVIAGPKHKAEFNVTVAAALLLRYMYLFFI